jgi:hypothetical protein
MSFLFSCCSARIGNDSDDMNYLNTLWGKWMPPGSPQVAVDSRVFFINIAFFNAWLEH